MTTGNQFFLGIFALADHRVPDSAGAHHRVNGRIITQCGGTGVNVTILISVGDKSSGLLAKNNSFGYHITVVCVIFGKTNNANR